MPFLKKTGAVLSVLLLTACVTSTIDYEARTNFYNSEVNEIVKFDFNRDRADTKVWALKRTCRRNLENDTQSVGEALAKQEFDRCMTAVARAEQISAGRPTYTETYPDPRQRPRPAQTDSTPRRTQTCFSTHPVTGAAVPYNC